MNEVSAKLVSLDCKVDDRGFLYQIYGNYEKVLPELKRIYVVGNYSKGTIRGFHKHKGELKLYFVVAGSAKFVVIENNGTPSTYTLTFRKPEVLIVPPGFAHGWVSLQDKTIIIGMSNYSLEETAMDDIRIDPFSFGRDLWDTKAR